jgi:hypothetical protein
MGRTVRKQGSEPRLSQVGTGRDLIEIVGVGVGVK